MSEAVQVALISAGFPLIAAMATLLIPHLLRQKRILSAVAEQVTNKHSTNLRDDVTEAIAGIGKILKVQEQHTEELQILKLDMAWLRREQHDLSKRVDHFDEGELHGATR